MRRTAAVSSGRGRRARVVVLLTAISLLVAAPSVRADPGSAGESTPAGAAQSPSAADAQANPADAPGNSANAPGHAADGPELGERSGSPPHRRESEPRAGPPRRSREPRSVRGPAPAASADQGQVGNSHVTVRVDEPGSGSPVAQENRAEADAQTASASADGAPPPASVRQDVLADAGATQSDVANTTVTVRVGSPGDDGAVSQSNVATAASTTSADPARRRATRARTPSQDRTAWRTRASPFASSHPVTTGSLSQLNEASAAANTGDRGVEGARSSQEDVRNTSVSIRVESPGLAAPPPQVAQTQLLTRGLESPWPSPTTPVTRWWRSPSLSDDLDRPGPAGLAGLGLGVGLGGRRVGEPQTLDRRGRHVVGVELGRQGARNRDVAGRR